MGAGLRIEAMTAAHLADAAGLLAARHRADRARVPALPERFEDADATLELLRAGFETPGTTGVVATRHGQPAGFLIGSPAFDSPRYRPRSTVMEYGRHAVAAGEGGEVYRAMYAALAPEWVGIGSFAHHVTVPAADREALAAWRSLGFGMEHATGLRDLATPDAPAGARPSAGLELRQAGVDDAEAVGELGLALHRYHARTPIFDPYFGEDEERTRGLYAEQLQNEETVIWLAVLAGKTVGMLVFGEPRGWRVLLTPERDTHLMDAFVDEACRGAGAGRALLDRALDWAQSAGHEHCTVSWASANLSGAAFWLGMGFRPVAYRLCRVVDERVAWAHGR